MRRLLTLPLLALPGLALAQIPATSTRGLSMGGAYTAAASGFEAVSWNPALLATSRQPGLSIGLPQVRAQVDNNAYSIGDILDYRDKDLSDADKQYLLDRIVNDDSTWIVRGDFGAGTLGFQVGALAFSFSSSGGVAAGASRDAVEFALNGNGQFTGTGNFFDLAGSGGSGWAASTLAGSYGRTFKLGGTKLAAGVTVKRVWGSFIGIARDNGSQVSDDTVNAVGQVLYTDYANGFEGMGDLLDSPGSGWGFDLGGALELTPNLKLGVVLVNAVGGMSWDEARLRYDRSTYVLSLSATGIISDTSSQTTLKGSAIDNDPQARSLRDTLLSTTDFARILRGGVAWRSGMLTLTGDMAMRLSEGLDRQSHFAVAGGAELSLLGFLALRGGFRSDFEDTTALSGGLGLGLGPVKIDFGGVAIMGSSNPGVAVGAGIGLVF